MLMKISLYILFSLPVSDTAAIGFYTSSDISISRMDISSYFRSIALAGAGIMAVYAAPYSLENMVYAEDKVAADPNPPNKKNAPAEKSLEEKVVDRINHYRNIAGLDPVVLDPELSKACQAHANYLMVNDITSRTHTSSSIHSENPKLPGYTKEGADIASQSDIGYDIYPLISIDSVMKTVFHRVNGILDPTVISTGIGYISKLEKREKKEWVVIGSKSNYKKVIPNPVSFPTDGQQDVPLNYSSERPDPIPYDMDSKRGNAGFPITITFYNVNCPSQADGVLQKIKGKKKEKVDAWFYSPDAPADEEYGKNVIYLIAKDRLEPKTTYEVTVTGTLNNKPWEKTWQFTTVKQELSEQVRPTK